MNRIIISLVKGIITAGLKSLLELHRVKSTPEKHDRLIAAITIVTTELKPIADATKTKVDDDILEILTNATN